MCLYVCEDKAKLNIHSEYIPHRLDKPVRVYKILSLFYDGEICTPYRMREVKFEDGQAELVADIFPSFIHKAIGEVDNGVHAYYKAEDAAKHLKLAVVHGWYDFCAMAVVPAGTGFYIGKNGDIVAERMIIFDSPTEYYRYTKGKTVIDEDSLMSSL